MVIGQVRIDTRLYDEPPKRKKGQRGRPRKYGRKYTPKRIAHLKRSMVTLPLYGKEQEVRYRPRDRFWGVPAPKIDSAFDNLLVPQPSWSPSTTQQLRKLVAAPYLSPNDWTPRLDAYFVFPLAQGTPGKQCGLAATGVYQPSLRSPWLAAEEIEALLPWNVTLSKLQEG